jgi:hypothetical protein
MSLRNGSGRVRLDNQHMDTLEAGNRDA